MAHKNAVHIFFSFTFIAIVVLFFYLQKENNNDALQVDENILVNCPLQFETCRLNLTDGVKLGITLSPEGLPAMKPLTLKLESDQIDFLKISNFNASFKGRDMEMGYHTLTLNSQSSNLLLAEGLIPLCPMDPMMVWVLNVTFEHQSKVTSLTFEVSSERH